MKYRNSVLFSAMVTVLAFFAAVAFAQNDRTPVVRAGIAPDSVSVGDLFTINVEVDKDLVQVVEFPEYKGQTIADGNIEVLDESGIDTVKRDGRSVTIRKQYKLMAFEQGIYRLGSFPVLYADKNVVDTLISADTLQIMVTAIAVDTTSQQIYDIKPPMHTPVVFAEWSGYLVMGYLLLQVVAAIVYIVMKRRRDKNGKGEKKRRFILPPHVTAIAQLEKLNSEKLWQNNRHKLYYTRLTDIIREYIEERYGVAAMEMTSDEIFEELDTLIADKRIKSQLSRLLSTADYVKFAKYTPEADDNEMSYNDAYYFIEDTKLESQEVQEVDGEEPEKASENGKEGTSDE